MIETAAQRFKQRFADAVERLCIIEEQLAGALERVAELEAEAAEKSAGNDVAETENAGG